ncbi:alpha/beta fold hydrolase [Actinomadura rugatobispora]|uniref:Alpha/beta fold hydrolase n=1 Tax=Actinomadura rugatobispora TaxID=1994 RepID=A0ABW0ZRB2_9ACTN|nr:alpha/beta fold hydrolase [Actinomadura rugatobispora]
MSISPVAHHWTGPDGNTLVGDVWGPEHPQVVLLHGGGQTRRAWGRTGEHFAERGLTTAAIDLRGHGESSWDPRGRYAFPDHARDLTTLRQNVFARPVILVGASLGGVTSLKSAQVDPDGIAAVVLVDITPTMQLTGVDKIVGFMRSNPDGFATLEEAAYAIARYQPHRKRHATPAGLRRNLRHDPETDRWVWHWDPRTLNFANPPWYAKQTRDMVAGTRALDAAGRPVQVVRGELSDVILPSDVDDFLALGAHTRHVTVVGARHMVAGDANEVFLQMIFKALGEVDPRLVA